jgi:putative aminopeptidase FrvX
MEEDQWQFFKALIEAPSPSGFEQPARQVWCERVQEVADSLTIDRLGSAIAAVNPSGNPRVMLAGHIDEIGFIVTNIDDQGFIYFNTVGGFDPSTLPGNRVKILGPKGPVIGCIGRKPVHLTDADERKKAPEIRDMWIDIGAENRADAESRVEVGNPVTRYEPVERLPNDRVIARGIDDKMGAYVVAEVLRAVALQRPAAAVYAVSTVQEEIGLRGARTSAFAVDPAIGIAVDVTWTTDHPKFDRKDISSVKIGAGPVITIGANINPRIYALLLEAARSENIPHQIDAQAGGTGTDANVMQLSRSGVATGLVSVATRYLHTASEVLDLKDIDNAVKLISTFILRLTPETSLVP